MTSAAASQEAVVADIVKKVALYDIRSWGPYPETNPEFRRAAVLLPITVSPEGQVFILLTKRSKHLRSHPSATAFPGGVREETDSSDIETALREAEEEIGLPPSSVQVLAVLTRGITMPNIVVYPVVGLIPYDFVPLVNPSEVEFAFLMPLKEFLNEEKVSFQTFNIQGQSILSRSVVFSDGNITANVWGFTANYCTLLAKIIFDETDCLPIFTDNQEKLCNGLFEDMVKYFELVTLAFKVKSNL